MQKLTGLITALALTGILALSSCKKNNVEGGKELGYIYTTTNGEGTNQVVRFSRHADGSLTNETAYSTNSNGGANVAAGGDAHGDFDAQGGIQIIDNYFLNVNAGGNQVSVFSLDRSNGNLIFKNNTSSGGTRPVSLTYTRKAGTTNEYWVVAGNQWNNPNVQKDGAAIERYPNNAFHSQNLTLADATDNERNIHLFSFNSSTGVLTSERQLDKYVRENGGPSCVSFSDDGTRLAVGTWGIAHFGTPATSLTEQHPSRVYVYVYDFANGNISNRRFFEEAGIAGTIGFNWAKGSNSVLYVSNFNLIPAKITNSLTVLTANAGAVIKTANFGVTTAAGINEACWTALNPAGTKLYVSSFATNLVSTFSVNQGNVNFAGVEARAGLRPPGDSKDLYVTPDDKHLYNLGAFQSYSINAFNISGTSVGYKSQTFLATTAAAAGVVGKFNFMGLTGFDLP